MYLKNCMYILFSACWLLLWSMIPGFSQADSSLASGLSRLAETPGRAGTQHAPPCVWSLREKSLLFLFSWCVSCRGTVQAGPESMKGAMCSDSILRTACVSQWEDWRAIGNSPAEPAPVRLLLARQHLFCGYYSVLLFFVSAPSKYKVLYISPTTGICLWHATQWLQPLAWRYFSQVISLNETQSSNLKAENNIKYIST